MSDLQRSIDITQVVEWNDGELRRVEDSLVAEEPLEIRVAGRPLSVTMRTPGNDVELAAGFLLTEGIIESADQIMNLERLRIGGPGRRNVVDFALKDVVLDQQELQRNFFATSSCGICGKASIESIRHRGLQSPKECFRLDPEILCHFPEVLRSQQKIFGRTGGLHAAALFTATGEMVVSREDIGRHNAVDKIVGWALLNGRVPLEDSILIVSGRGGFEIVQKALAAGVPVIASVSAPSSLAVKLAREFGATLIGFLRGRRFVVYSGTQRLPST